MSPECTIIKFLISFDFWKENRHKIPNIEEPFIGRLYKALDGLLEEVSRDVSFDELEAFYGANIKPDSQEEKDFAKNTFNHLRSIEIGTDVANSILTTIQDRSDASKLASKCIEVVEGRENFNSLLLYMERKRRDREESEDHRDFIDDDLDSIYDDTINEPGLNWRVKALRESLGPLRVGDFGFIFARPETGKTTFLASEISYFSEQIDKPILWVNNEEQGKKVMLRIYQASLGLTLEEMLGDRKQSREKFMELTKGHIRLHDSASVHYRKVEQLCEKLEPALVVIDQIDKLKGFSADREDLHLGAIYIWAREIAKTYCPVIGVCQAAGTAEGKQWLTMDDVANAKTAKQAEADFILGIGKIHTEGYEKVRFLNLCKNKLIGSNETNPDLRHAKLTVRIDADIARYGDIE